MVEDTPVYFDYQATTPTDPRVLEAMLPWFTEQFGNPHSASHSRGARAEQAVERARLEIAEFIGADPREIIFTSGATEANNLAIQGAFKFHKDRRNGIVTLATEHKCVLESCRAMERDGAELTILPVQPDGLVDLELLIKAVTDQTAVVSVMTANNEIGTIQPIEQISAICAAKGALFHTDAAQALGKIDVDVRQSGVNLMSMSAHKVYGPMGIGVLYVRRRPRSRIKPLFFGGGQERGLRSGTIPTPLAVGFGKACEIASAETIVEQQKFLHWKETLLDALREKDSAITMNGSGDQRLAGNLNLTVPGYTSEELFGALNDFEVSSGSACTSASVEPSYVLRALGLDSTSADSSIRISFGRPTTEAEVKLLTKRLLEL